MSLLYASALELRDRFARGEVGAEELVAAFLNRIAQWEPRIKAFLHVDREGALRTARALDARRVRGEKLGQLAGVPIAIKDNLCTRDQPTTCASRMLAGFRPPYDAHVVERLRAEDAILIGKTNLDEFAMGSSTENSAFQVTRNPWNTERIPGGSSGGSAAAVAAGMVPLAIGSDTGGSIRQPAALCGVVGLKPTYGRVSRYGLVAFASSLDQIGPLARDVRDVALLLSVIADHDARDSTCAPLPACDYLAALEDGTRQLRVGVPREYFGEGLDAEVAGAVRDAIGLYARMGAEVVDISLPHTSYALATYYIIAPSEASSNLARYDGAHYGYRAAVKEDIVRLFCRTRAEGFGAEVQRRILLGTYALSAGYYDAYYLKAARVRRLIKQDFDAAFEMVDVIMCPTSPTAAFRLGERTGNPLAMYLADVFTIPANLAGLPAISIPCGFTSDGLPIGLQIIGKPFDEVGILRVAHRFERETDYHRRRPPEG